MKNWTDTQTAPCGPPLTRCTSWDRCLCPPTTSALQARKRRCVASSFPYVRWVVGCCLNVCLLTAYKMVDLAKYVLLYLEDLNQKSNKLLGHVNVVWKRVVTAHLLYKEAQTPVYTLNAAVRLNHNPFYSSGLGLCKFIIYFVFKLLPKFVASFNLWSQSHWTMKLTGCQTLLMYKSVARRHLSCHLIKSNVNRKSL